MAETQSRSKVIGAVVGAVLVIAAVSAVFVDWDTQVDQPPPPVRPLKTITIGSRAATLGRKYPGKVRANQEVALAFNVAGPLIELHVLRGDQVEKGKLLAKVDPRDYENILAAKQGVLAMAKSDHEKVDELVKAGAANPRELTQAKAALEVAQAERDIAAKALEDTKLVAPFAGVIANRFVEQFQNVQAKEAILSLQDVSEVEIRVSVPEEQVALSQQGRGRFDMVAVFDYLPDHEPFPVQMKEYATEADPATQTFTAILVMTAPEDVRILPGMTATVIATPKETETTSESQYAVPIDAVPIDGQGQYYVWVVEGADGETMTVHRRDVTVHGMHSDVVVVEGVQVGERIATAGVHLLQEGQQVRPFEAGDEAGSL